MIWLTREIVNSRSVSTRTSARGELGPLVVALIPAPDGCGDHAPLTPDKLAEMIGKLPESIAIGDRLGWLEKASGLGSRHSV